LSKGGKRKKQQKSMTVFAFIVGILLLVAASIRVVDSYPVIALVDDGAKRCFRFNIPEDDDVNVVVMALPTEDQVSGGSDKHEKLEQWYVDQVYQMTLKKDKYDRLEKKLPNEAPSDVAAMMSDFLKGHQGRGNKAGVQVILSTNPGPNWERMSGIIVDGGGGQHYDTNYFVPTVMNHVRRTSQQRNKWQKKNKEGDRADRENLEGYGICLFNNDEHKMVEVIFDVVLISEEYEDDDDFVGGEGQEGFHKDRHLTPLETTLDHSISAANSVLREMRYMEKREARMRKTAESINYRVKWFSYLSVGVLLSVTYVQVTYLKSYFRKKKLL